MKSKLRIGSQDDTQKSQSRIKSEGYIFSLKDEGSLVERLAAPGPVALALGSAVILLIQGQDAAPGAGCLEDAVLSCRASLSPRASPSSPAPQPCPGFSAGGLSLQMSPEHLS